MRRQLLEHYFWIIAASALVFFTNLGTAALWDEDEPLYASCAREMLDRGDWVVPRFNGQMFPDKPPLMYWTMIAGYKFFGANELGARCGAALLGIATALATYHLGRRLFSAQVGLWAGLIVASTFIFTVSARAATVDCAMAFLTTMAMLVFVLGGMGNAGEAGKSASATGARDFPSFVPQSWFSFALLYVLLGLAVLGKGPIGLLLPMASLGLFLMVMNLLESADRLPAPATSSGWLLALVWIGRLWRPGNFFRSLWQLRPLTALLVVAAVTLPWYALVGIRTEGQWLKAFFFQVNVGILTKPVNGHGGPFWYYVPAILIGFFPWSVFLGPALADWTRRIRQRHPWWPGYVLLACWSGVTIVFWSLCRSKLPHYMVPIFPALALGTAALLDHWLADPAVFGRRSARAAWGITVLVGLGFVAAFPVLAAYFLPGQWFLGLVGLILVFGGGASFYLTERGRRQRAVVVFAGMSVCFIASVFGLGTVWIDRHQNARPMLAAIQEDGPAGSQLAGYRFLQKSYVFYAGRPVPCFDDVAALGQFLGQASNSYVFVNAKSRAELEAAFPGQFEVLIRQRRFLRQEDVLVLAHRDRRGLGQRPRGLSEDSSTRGPSGARSSSSRGSFDTPGTPTRR